jgi:hypothetical protein
VQFAEELLVASGVRFAVTATGEERGALLAELVRPDS